MSVPLYYTYISDWGYSTLFHQTFFPKIFHRDFCTHTSFVEYNNISEFQIHTSKINLPSYLGQFQLYPLSGDGAPYLEKHSFQTYFSVIFCTHTSFIECNSISKFQICRSKIRQPSNFGHF